MINSCAVAALYAADTIFLVTNPDVPSIRNSQRLVDRVRQLGAGSERVKILLNRVSDQNLIAPKQIETALGLRHPPHVLERLSDRVDRTQLGRPARADEQLGNFDAVRRLHTSASRPSGRREARAGATQGIPRDPLIGTIAMTVSITPTQTAGVPPRPARVEAPRPQYLELKANVHRKLLNRLNLEALASAERPRAEAEIRTLLFELIAEEGMPLTMTEREGDPRRRHRRGVRARAARTAAARPGCQRHPGEYLQAGLRRALAANSSGCRPRSRDDKHLMRVIDRIVSGVGRRVDDSSPMVDARLPDGSRVNAIIPPLAVDGPLLSIRRFPPSG